ncbi:MAG: hypothetical protein ACOYEF_02770 [Planifilum sp.]|jgi:hypothetical protein
MSTDIMGAAVKALRAAGIAAKQKNLDSLTGEEGTVVRSWPQINTRYDMDMDEACDWIIAVTSRSRSEERALDACTDAASALAAADFESADGSFTQNGRGYVYQEPQRLAIDAHGLFAWQAAVAIPITKESR